MVRVGKEAAHLRLWSDGQRLSALKRIIPQRQVTEALRRSGHGRTCCSRTPDAFMVWFVVALGLFCDDCYRQIYRWLVPWKKGDVPGRSTLCEARQRVGVGPLVRLAIEVIKLLARPETPGAFYRGMRLMALDGFVVDIPDMPANDKVFGRPGGGRAPGAFPQAHVLGLVEAGTHVFWRWLVKPCHTGEITMTPPLLKHLQGDMLLLWDRNFLKYEHVRQILGRQAHLLARIKKNLVFQPLRRLRDGSYLAKLYKSAADRKQDRGGILVRIIEYTFDDPKRPGNGEKHRLLTTLLDARQDPAKTLVALYHVRWEQELAIDEFKTHEMERPVLRSQTPAGVVQEIYGLMLGHYVLRSLMHEAAKKVPISPLRMSFVGTLKILRCRLPECPRSRPARKRWWRNLLQEVAEEVIPKRRHRINPRVIKKKMSNWPKKRPEHRHYPQPAKQFRDSIVMMR
jgi:hypothetical protein